MTGRTNAGGGVQLPALTNPAAAGNIQSGYQAINGEGEVVTGTAKVQEYVSVQLQLLNCYVSYTGSSGGQYVSRPTRTITVLKNSALVVQGNPYGREVSGGLEELNSMGSLNNTVVTYKVTGDGSIIA